MTKIISSYKCADCEVCMTAVLVTAILYIAYPV